MLAVNEVVTIATILFTTGVTYGVLKSNFRKMNETLDKLIIGNEKSTIVEERQSIINGNMQEKLDFIQDRLDLDSIAIQNLEKDVIKIKAKCSLEEC